MAEGSPKKPAAPKKKTVKKPAEHPKFIEMIIKAITELKERNGSSKQAIEKYIKEHYKVGDNARVYIKQGILRGVKNGLLKQVKGIGASGSFKLGEKAKAKPKAKKPAAAKKKPAAKKPAAKKSTPKKKAAAKKTSAKKTSAKKPKSAKKSTKKTTAKKPTPKKVKKTAAKKKASSAKKAKK